MSSVTLWQSVQLDLSGRRLIVGFCLTGRNLDSGRQRDRKTECRGGWAVRLLAAHTHTCRIITETPFLPFPRYFTSYTHTHKATLCSPLSLTVNNKTRSTVLARPLFRRRLHTSQLTPDDRWTAGLSVLTRHRVITVCQLASSVTPACVRPSSTRQTYVHQRSGCLNRTMTSGACFMFYEDVCLSLKTPSYQHK